MSTIVSTLTIVVFGVAIAIVIVTLVSVIAVVVNVFVVKVRSGSLRSVCNAYFMYVIYKTDEETENRAEKRREN